MKRAAIAMILLLSAGTAAWAEAVFQYYVFPVTGITGISRSALSNQSDAKDNSAEKAFKYSGMIDQKYADIFLDDDAQKSLIRHFEQLVIRGFPSSVIGANQVNDGASGTPYSYSPYRESQCGPKFRADYRDAFVIALGVSRLSTYFNTYDDFTQVLIPITYTIRFVKLDGASVVFSKSATIYTQYDTATKSFYDSSKNMSADVLGKLKAAIADDAKVLIERLVADAVANFKPRQSEVAIVGKEDGYIIFDKGSEIGFSSGEEIEGRDASGADFSFVIKYATDGTAIATASHFTPEVAAAVNGLKVGKKLAFSFSKRGTDDAKPAVLSVQYTPYADKNLNAHQIIANALQAIVADDIGYKAPFNLLKQDPDFWNLKTQIRSEANCDAKIYQAMTGFADNTTVKRPDPAFFLKLDYTTSPAFTATGVGGVTSKTQFISGATLGLIDKAGIIRQVFVASAAYELARSGGKGLSFEQGEEVNLKNATLNAMVSMVSGFSPNKKIIKISAINGAAVTLGEIIPESAFKSLQIVRPLRVNAGKTILLPLPSDEIQFDDPAKATASFVVKGKGLKTTDVVILSDEGGSHRLLKLCDASKKKLFLPAALKDPSNMDGLLGLAVASGIKGYYLLESDSSFIESASFALSQGKFASSKLAPLADTQFCANPLESQQIGKNECVGGKCSGNGTTSAGVRVFEQNNKIAESAEGGKFEYSNIDEREVSRFFGYKSTQHMINSISPIKAKLN